MLMETRLGEIARALTLLTDEKIWFASVTKSVLDEIVRLITEDQLASGIDGKGQYLGDYAPYSIAIRRSLGLQVDHIDLKLTGEFYDSITANVISNGIEVDGDGQKPDQNLFTTFGNDIISLTDENLQYIIEEVKENYLSYIYKALGLDT